MSDRTASLVVGGFLLLLSVGTAMGAVSLGSFLSSSASGYAEGSYLVYNSVFEILSFLLALAGAYFFYESGKAARLSPRPVK